MSTSSRPLVTLIGGPARVGKTTLAQRIATQAPSELVHLDHLLHALKAVAHPETKEALNKAPSINTHNQQQWLTELRARDHALWAGASAYITAARGPLIMEGCLWPDWVSELPIAHTAVFVIDTSDSGDRLTEIAAADPENWMTQRGWPEEKIRRWALCNQYRSHIIAEQALRHGYPIFDIAAGISAAQDHALKTLTNAAGQPAEEGCL